MQPLFFSAAMHPTAPQKHLAARLDSQGLVFARAFAADGKARALASPPAQLPAEGEDWIWVHLDLVDRRALRWLAGLSLPSQMQAAFSSEDTRPHLDHVSGFLAGTFAEMTAEPARQMGRERLLRFLIGRRLIITGRHHPLQDVERLRDEIDHGLPASHPAGILERIIDTSLDRLQSDVDAMLMATHRIEDMVIEQDGTDPGGEIAGLRRKAITIHRELSLARPLLRRLAEIGTAMDFPAAQVKEAEAQLVKCDALQGEAQALQERARLLKDEVAANIASDMNHSLYIISLISALLLPPSLIFSLFGINVGGLPFLNTSWGFACVLALGMATSAFVFLLLRRAK